MNYSRAQKFLSFLVIFSLFFSITFRVPIFHSSLYAKTDDYRDIVSILVSENVYSSIRGDLERYAEDISSVLDNTQVVILPTPASATAYQIASLNESLYFEGIKGLQKSKVDSKLIGTVLVGNIPTPIVSNNNSSEKTILPYVDFKNKSYIYDEGLGRYVENTDSNEGVKPEIWHGVISPNTGSEKNNIQALKDYFKKNHDYYKGTGNFKLSTNIINGDKNSFVPSTYEPYVFYFDAFRESQSINFNNYVGYRSYLEHKEDIVYKRYTKALANLLQGKMLGDQNRQISEIASKVDTGLDLSGLSNGPDLSISPDIQTRHIVNNSIKKFVEIFSKGSIGTFRGNVHNAGRYNEGGSKVNIDLIPHLITSLDLVSDKIILDTNNDLEEYINGIVTNGLSRKIAIPTTYKVEGSGTTSCESNYENFLFGKTAKSITNASECTIYRGSTENGGKLVEANRGFNVHNVKGDVELATKVQLGGGANAHTMSLGYWGGNSPLNLDNSSASKGEIKLGNSDTKKSIRPLFDIAGSVESKNALLNPSPLQCYNTNLLLTSREELVRVSWGGGGSGNGPEYECRQRYTTPVNGVAYSKHNNNWNPLTYTLSGPNVPKLTDVYKNISTERCTRKNINLDGKVIDSAIYTDTRTNDGEYECSGSANADTGTAAYNNWKNLNYNYKSITSHIIHDAPTAEQLKEQVSSLITPDLPVNKDRYIDFVAADGKYAKIKYPNLFRINNVDINDVSFNSSKEKLKNHLDGVTAQINTLIEQHNPNTLSSRNKELYNLLRIGTYPNKLNESGDNVTLYTLLKDKKSSGTIRDFGDTKEVNYLDTLAFAVHWNNLNSVSAKYKFIFEHYLSDQYDNNFSFNLPKNKKLYEIAYLAGFGDSKNMYVKVDPESKADNPYADIISQNLKLSSALLGVNVSRENNPSDKGTFKCAPPEGVMIFEWIPAIMCWLTDMLPPAITISEGTCGVTLLSVDEREEFEQCNGDVNKNGVNDCIEKKFDGGKISLSSDASNYYYLKSGKLTARILDKNGVQVRLDNVSKVDLKLSKVETLKDKTKEFTDDNIEIIYDRTNGVDNKFSKTLPYIDFSDTVIPVSGGEAHFGFSSKSKEANYYFTASITVKDKDDKEFKKIISNDLKIEVRSDRIFASSYVAENILDDVNIESSENIIEAHDEKNIYLFDSYKHKSENIIPKISKDSKSEKKLIFGINSFNDNGVQQKIKYPLSVELTRNGINISEAIIVPESSLREFISLGSYQDSGNYTLSIVDKSGQKITKDFVVEAADPAQIITNMGATVTEIGGAVTSNVSTILDRFGNPVVGKFNKLNVEIEGTDLVFEENDSQKLTSTVFEGYKIFRLKTKNKTGTAKLKFTLADNTGKKLLSSTKELKILKQINLTAQPLGAQFKVGGEEYSFKVLLRGEGGSVLSDYTGRIYFTISDIYGKPTQSYFKLVNGEAIVTFITGTVAGKDIAVEFQAEGLSKIAKRNITIYPEAPIKVDLSMSSDKVEAKQGDVHYVKTELKDKYGNVVFNDNTTTTSIEILPKYKGIISELNQSAVVKGGTSTMGIKVTDTPGVGYFKISTSPDLSKNTFIIKDGGKDVKISGVGENVGKLETFFFWNKKIIDKTKYNALYSTLLGANYGDYSQKDYLAGSVLFNKDNRALAVTSLLNNPYNYNDVLSVLDNGAIQNISASQDLSQNIVSYVEIVDDYLQINYKNDSLNSFVGKFTYRFSNDTNFELCPGTDFNACINTAKNTGIYLQSIDQSYKTFKEKSNLILRDQFGKTILTIKQDGSVEKNGIFTINVGNTGHKYAIFEIVSGNKVIAKLAFNMKDFISTISRDITMFNNKGKTLKNALIGYLASNSYGSRDLVSQNNNQTNIYYNDPFSSEYTLNEFSKSNQNSYENSVKKGGLGWAEANKTLLNFSAGASVGESVKEYQSFSVVNLGDPVVSLKKIRKKLPKTSQDRKFDSTVGNLISDDEKIESYQIFDYNNDNLDDILIVQNDDYLLLYENTATSEFVQNKGFVAQVADLSSPESLKAGDFTGDGYDDIFFVNDNKEPFLLNNNEKDFYRIALSDVFKLNGKVVQSEVFDMDSDGILDIVILDDSGEINVFYGGGTGANPKFTKLNIGKDYAITLDSSSRTDKGAVYYEGIISKSSDSFKADKKEELSKNIADLQKKINQLKNNGSAADGSNLTTESSGINDDLADNIIFVTLPYGTEIVTRNSTTGILETLELPESNEFGDAMTKTQESLQKFLEENKKNIDINATYKKTKQVSFVRTEYSELADISVKKTYNDVNGKPLQSEDYIDVKVTLLNTGNKVLKKFAYADESLDIFEFQPETLEVPEGMKVSTDIAGYNFIIDGFNLNPGEKKTLIYRLKTYPIKYGNIQVGKFEKGSAGDDNYGDVLFKGNKENCSQASDILASIGARSYKKEITNPQCDADKLKLPGVLEQNKQDENNNGVPDYIDNLISGSTADKENYASTQLAKMNKDSDGDGIPDSDDDSNFAGSLTSNLDKMSENVNDVLDGVDTIMQGLSCGFGGGGCIATPLNWAPLAPGGDPTLFGYPAGDGFMVGEGIPTISGLTGINVPTPAGCYQVPAVWPLSPLMFTGVCNGTLGAGGYLGTMSPTNTFRIFVTPTITGAVGMAACFGGPPIVAGYSNMPGMHPLVPGGNCVIAATPLIGCEDDGSDGDIASTGFAQTTAGGFGIYNGNCKGGSSSNQTSELNSDFVKEYFQYKKTGKPTSELKDKFKKTFSTVAKGTNTPVPGLNGPLVNINGQGAGDQVSVNVDFSSLKSGNFADIIKIQKQKVSDFPSFLMSDWIERQIEEIVTKLTDFPTLYIILPDFSGVLDTGTNEGSDMDDVITADENISSFVGTGTINSANSGIKEAYAFLSNIPLVNISQESVNINVPWVDEATVDKTVILRKETLDGRKNELERAKEAWSFGQACNKETPEEQKECEDKNAASEKIIVQTEGLIRSLEQNLEVIESYKNLPKDINTLINSKEKYIEQVMCNVESIGEILGGWIGKNGERFKAWVELYVLIKAILKSWQLMVDIFIDYEAECHQCKNERGDLQTFIWEMISAVIPQMPIILFPKWPDIIMDLHNIRAGLDIALPEFKFTSRPIILPLLPDLILPDVPTVNINLPTLPVLPTIVLPELPDLPSLPTVELPNLPPPPTLPKLFASLEGVVDILKLITKAMCILKTSPFVPEWRAGDQIAFITERQGYLPTDFLNLSMPQFSYPFVDAIKVTSYVNLEFETDFIIQLAEQIAMPINSFSNDATRVLDIQVSDLDFSRVIPTQIDVNLDGSSNIETEISQENIMKNMFAFVMFAKAGIEQGLAHLEENKNITVSNKEFKQIVFENLASDSMSADPKFESLRNVWKEVDNYTYSKENKYIQELEKNNYDKFETLKNILSTELQRTREESKNIQKLLEPKYVIPVAKEESRISAYNDQLSVYNERFIESAHNLINGDTGEYKDDLKNKGNELLAAVSTPISKYRASTSGVWGGAKTSTTNTCSASNNSQYSYNYKGLYVVEDDTSYRLFDYLEEVDGEETTTVSDLDGDGDEDLLYMSKGAIYFKENLNIIRTNTKSYESLTFSANDNKFFNGSFIPAVNNFKEISIDSGSINMKFKSSTNSDIHNYRVEYYPIIDKFENIYNDSYRPKGAKKSIIDGFSNTDKTLLKTKLQGYSLYSNLAYIDSAGTLNGITVETPSLTNITSKLSENTVVNISVGTAVYSGKQSVTLEYTQEGSDDLIKVLIPKYSHIIFDSSVKILGASTAAYIQNTNTQIYEGEEIRLLLGKPLGFGTQIWFKNNQKGLSEKSYVDIKYFDETEANLHFTEIDKYELYNLGFHAESHVIRTNQENDYYYAKIYAFNKNNFSTASSLTLLAPQVVADDNSPELSLAKSIKIPVYQKQIFDFTPFIYEDGGIKNIQNFWIDMDPESDENNDGDPKNDKTVDKVSIKRTLTKITAEFGEYDSLIEKEIAIGITDTNGNTSVKNVQFEVYSPTPEIENISEEKIIGYINEDLENEPVRLFRVRGGVITPIESSENLKETLTENGEYKFPISQDTSGLTLSQNGINIAEINEETGKIISKQVGVKVSVYSSNDPRNKGVYPSMNVVKNNEIIYNQEIKVGNTTHTELVENFDLGDKYGLFVQFLDKSAYNYYQIPESVSYNPGALVIYRNSDVHKEPLFIIYKDGRIDTINGNYKLEYSHESDYVILRLVDAHFAKTVAEVMYKVQGEYIMQ